MTHSVARGRPNAFGLYDTHGKAREWVQDVWHENYQGVPGDGLAWLSGGDQARRVLRAGGWSNFLWGLRSANRGRNAPDTLDDYTGLQIAGLICFDPNHFV